MADNDSDDDIFTSKIEIEEDNILDYDGFYVVQPEVSAPGQPDDDMDVNDDADVNVDIDDDFRAEAGDPQPGSSRQQGSPVWKCFVKITHSLVKCQLCKEIMSRIGSSTTPMWQHLKKDHPQKWSVLDPKRRDVDDARGVSEEQDLAVAKRRKPSRRGFISSTSSKSSSSIGRGCKLSFLLGHGN